MTGNWITMYKNQKFFGLHIFADEHVHREKQREIVTQGNR
jgi:hypothetical protein